MKVYFSTLPKTCPVGETGGRKVREFVEVFTFSVNDKIYSIPKGCQVDGSSIPRWPVIWLLFGDEGEIAGDIHDLLYRKESKVSKEFADSVFLAAMEFSGDPESSWKRKAMYYAVRWFGAGSYHKKGIMEKLC